MPEFTLIAQAVVEVAIQATDAQAALVRWRRWHERHRAWRLHPWCSLLVDGDPPIVLDREGKRVQVAEDREPERKPSVTGA